MAVINITRKYKAGTNAERLALTPSAEAGTVFWAIDTLSIWSCDGTSWIQIGASGAAFLNLVALLAGERHPDSPTLSHMIIAGEWTLAIVTGSTSEQNISNGAPAILGFARVGGTAALTGNAQLKNGTSVFETFLSAAVVGAERNYGGGLSLPSGLRVQLAQAADTIILGWRNA